MSPVLKEQDIRTRYQFLDHTKIALLLDQSDGRSNGDVGNWYDLSGLNRHVVQAAGGNQPTIQGALNLSGTARSFDGVSHRMEAESVFNPYGNSNKEFSVVIWTKYSTEAAGETIIGQFDADDNRSWRILNTNGSTFIVSDNINFKVYVGPDLTDGLWHQIVFTWEYVSGADGTLLIYIDGAIITPSIFLDGNITTLHPPAENLLIGCVLASGVYQDFSEVDIDFALLYSGVLTAAQIQQFYLVDKPRHGGM